MEAPAFTVSAVGERTRLKSVAGSTVRVRLAECVSPANVPLAVRVKLPAATVAGMERVTAWLPPAGTLNGEAGEAVTPAGNPESVTTTESLNPFCPVIDTAKEVEPPAVTVSVEGTAAMLKS